MTETGWQAIGRIAKERRERLGLRQDELVQFGGPRVSTVGKFERAAQQWFPLRTQHQMEKALGWPRSTVEQVVNSLNEGALDASDWEYDLVEEHIPDMSEPATAATPDGSSAQHLESFAAVFRLIDLTRRDEALRAALVAILPFLTNEGASALGQSLRVAFPPAEGGDGNADDERGSAAIGGGLSAVDGTLADAAKEQGIQGSGEEGSI